MMYRLFVLAFLAVSPIVPALAEDCSNAVDQASMNECAGKNFKRSDAELNTVYRQIQQRLKDNADGSKLLVAAQRSWVAFRDAECTFSNSAAAQGSIYPMIYAMCLDGMTQVRIKELRVYLNCEEGDMSCLVPAAD